MGPETVATLVLVAVLVAVLAVYILAIGFALRRLSFTLGTIVIGLRAIAQQTGPVGAVVGDLIRDVDAIEDALDGLTGAVVTAKKAPRRYAGRAVAGPPPSRARPPRAVAWKPGAGEPESAAETADERDDVVATRAPGSKASVGAITGGRNPGGRRTPGGQRAQARSSRRAPRAAPGAESMTDAVVRAREKVGMRSRP